MTRSRLMAAALAAGTTALVAACGSSSGSSNPLASGSSAPASSAGSSASSTVVIGSANFPENEVLADIYAGALKAKGVNVQTKLNIGSREVIYKLIQSGQLTVLPEYNGALLDFLDAKSPANTTSEVDQALASKLPATLKVLDPAQAEDKDGITVTQATASKYSLKSIGDLAPVASKLVIGGPPEFRTRQQGIVGLKNLYGLTFKAFKPLDTGGPVTIAALKGGQVDVADVFTTDPSITQDHFVTLADPKNLYSAENVIPLVYSPGVNQTIIDALNAVSAKLDTATLLKLDTEVQAEKKDATAVAQEFLTNAGLG